MAFSASTSARFRYGQVNQSDLYRESLKKYARGTDDHFDAMDAIKVSKVSAAKEFEDFRQLPKYSHVPLAVIHPSPVKRMQKPRRPDPDFELNASPQRLVTRPGRPYEIPESLMKPPTEISVGKKARPKSSLGFGSSQPRFGQKVQSRKSGGNAWQNKLEADRAKIDAEKARVANLHLKVFYDAIKDRLDQPDDDLFMESVDPYMTVREAKNFNMYADLIPMINRKVLGLSLHKNEITKLEFRALVQACTKRLTDSQCNDIFNVLTKQSDSRKSQKSLDKFNSDIQRDDRSASFSNKRRNDENTTPRQKGGINVGKLRRDEFGRQVSPGDNSPQRDSIYDNTTLDCRTLQTKFTTYVKTQESMSSILNVKLIRQRFADFQTKLKVWRVRDRFRRLLKKQFKRNVARLNEVFEYAIQTFQNDADLANECSQVYSDFQDYLRMCYKNEKVMNSFLCNLPENAQQVDTDDLSRLILKQETAHAELRDLYTQFVGYVKNECVMNVHFFAFTNLPEMIVRKNYTRKQYEQLTKLLVSVKEAYLQQRAKEQEEIDKEEEKKQKDLHLQPKTDQNVITEEDLVEIQLLDDFLVQHQRAFDRKKALWNSFIQHAKDETRDKLETLKEQKPTEKQKKLLQQYVFSNMLNTSLEANHEEMICLHFKHELMENQLSRKKHSVISPQSLLNKIKLILGCDDPKYQIKLATDEEQHEHNLGNRFSPKHLESGLIDCMVPKTNFWGETMEWPNGHTYHSMDELKEARVSLKRWSEEWRERKTTEMETFNGKREVNVNEGETASTMSQSRVSNKADKAQQLAQDAQSKFGGTKKERKPGEGRNVQFADEPQSPSANPDYNERGSDGKEGIRTLDKLLQDSNYDELDMDEMGMDRQFSTLEQLSKQQSRVDRDDEALQDELEEQQALAEQQQNIKQHFIDVKSGKQYDPDKRFGVIEDGTQLVYDNITTSYELNLPPDYYLKYIQDALPSKDDKKWFIRPHHLESLTNHYNSLKDDVLNTRYFSDYNQHNEKELTDNEQAIDYIERHLEQLRMKQNTMTLIRTNGEKDFEQYIEELKDGVHNEAYTKFQNFIKDKGPRPGSKQLCIEAYESILTHEREQERDQLNRQRLKEFEKNRPPASKWYELKSKDFSKELYRNRVALKPNNSNKVYLDILQDPYLY